MMDYDKLIHCLKCCARVDAQNVGCDDCGLEYCGEECQQLCGTAATAIETLRADLARVTAELADLRAQWDMYGGDVGITETFKELERVTAERNTAQALLAERSGVIGSAPITTAFGIPLERLKELVEADREGRCVVLDDLTVADLQQMLTVLDCTRYGDGAETYTTGYRNGHRNGRIEILRHVLGINEGDSAEAEAALRREQDE